MLPTDDESFQMPKIEQVSKRSCWNALLQSNTEPKKEVSQTR